MEIRTLDIIVVAVYLASMAGMALYFARRNTNTEEYFVDGRSFAGWVIGISMLGTVLSSQTFLALPAAAYKLDWRQPRRQFPAPAGGDCGYIGLFAAISANPFDLGFEYLQQRYGTFPRLYGTISFVILQVIRGAQILFLVSLPIQFLTGFSVESVIICSAIFVGLYTIVGGIDAVIWTDVIQTLVLIFGGIVCLLCIVFTLPNGKFDVNINPRPLAFPFPEENKGYLEADWSQRETILRRHCNLALGLLYFTQNDPEVPQAHRELAREYHLPKGEFADNDHFHYQLYVREGRRLRGLYTLTEHDMATTSENGDTKSICKFEDAIAVGEFPIDSFPTSKRQPNDSVFLEGYLGMLDNFTRPYQLPYRVMIPEVIDGIIVPVAVSTTHVAFSSVRMEPQWMVLGQAAGTAAHLAIKHNVSPRDVPIAELQAELTRSGQVIEYQANDNKIKPHHIGITGQAQKTVDPV